MEDHECAFKNCYNEETHRARVSHLETASRRIAMLARTKNEQKMQLAGAEHAVIVIQSSIRSLEFELNSLGQQIGNLYK